MMHHEKHGRKKARHMLSRMGYKAGGHVKGDKAQDAKMVAEGVHEHESHMHKGQKKTKLRLKDGGCADGGMAKPRADRLRRGGKAKAHKPHTQVNVMVGRSHPQPVPVPKPVPVPVPGGAPGPMAGPPPGAGPMPPPDGSMAPGGAPPMGLKRGGRAKATSGSGRDMKGGMPAGHFKKGGKTYPIKDGSGGGLARMQKAKAYGA